MLDMQRGLMGIKISFSEPDGDVEGGIKLPGKRGCSAQSKREIKFDGNDVEVDTMPADALVVVDPAATDGRTSVYRLINFVKLLVVSLFSGQKTEVPAIREASS
jgi:hypothetical protein